MAITPEELQAEIIKQFPQTGAQENIQKEEQKPEEDFDFSKIIEKNGGVDFKKVFGWTSTTIKKLWYVFKDEDWPEEYQWLIPPKEKFTTYQPQKKEIETLVMGFEQGDNIWVSGPTGSGKTTMVEFVCSKLRIPFIRVNGRGDMESGPIFGQLHVEEENGVSVTKWVDGSVTEAVRLGCVVLVDEPTVIPAEISMGLQWLLESPPRLLLTDKPGSTEDKLVTPPDSFRLVCCDNTKGRGDSDGSYVGTNNWNVATLDRFGKFIELNYLAPAHEVAIITKNQPIVQKNLAEKMVKFANLVRKSYNQGELTYPMSPRTLLKWADDAVWYQDAALGLKSCFFDKFDDDQERHAVNNFFRFVFNKNIS